MLSFPTKSWKIEQRYRDAEWTLYHMFDGTETEEQRMDKMCDLKELFPGHNFRLTR